MFCASSCRFIVVLAIIANVLLILGAGYIFLNAYGRDTYIALALGVPPLLSIIALLRGPDKELRALETDVAKARLRRELAELNGTKS